MSFPRSSIPNLLHAPRKLSRAQPTRPDKAQIAHFQPEDKTMELHLEDRIGEGQWSTVWGATCVSKSEDLSKRCMSRTKLFAVKAVKGKLATEVALDESRILSYFMKDYEATEYVVPFHGFSAHHNGLVMDFISLTLGDFAHFFKGQKFTSKLLVQLQPIASACVAGLDYIHRHNVIHGDIKPSNILLRPIEQGSGLGIQLQGAQFQPLYCDFSAARYNSPDCSPSESAGTYDFMAPELFSLFAPDNWTSFATDVYALGVSLLYLVIGQSPYDYAHNTFQRRAMAMSARPLEAAGSNLEAAQKIRQTGVEIWIAQTIKSKALQRCTASEWKWKMTSMS